MRRRVSGSAKPAAASAAVSVGGIREALAVDLGDARDEAGDPHGLEVVRVERADREAAARGEHACGLGERRDELDVLDDLAHEGPVEPAGLEREPLGLGLLEAAAGDVAALRDREHLGGGVDAPGAGAAGGERLGDAARAAADVEDAAAVEPAELDERVEHRLPDGVARAQLVVALRERGERIWVRHRWDRD